MATQDIAQVGAVATDQAGNIFVTSSSKGRLVVKYAPTGDQVWAVGVTGSGSIHGKGIGLDDAGNVYIAGYFQGTADFDPGPGTASLTASLYDGFVFKLDSQGQFVWAVNIGGSGMDAIEQIAVDGSGNVFVTGQFQGTVDFDPGPGVYELTGAALADAFVVRLHSDGSLAWARQLGGSQHTKGQDVAVDASGHVYATGYFFGTAGHGLGSATSGDGYLLQFDMNGNLGWARRFGTSGWDTGHRLAVAGDHLYLTGVQGSPRTFDPSNFYDSLGSGSSYDLFISRYDLDGNPVWTRGLGTEEYDGRRNEIAVDSTGNVYLAGFFSGTRDLDPGLDSYAVTSAGQADVFVSRLDSAGNFLGAWSTGGSRMDGADGLALDGQDNLYIVGTYEGLVDFDPGPGVVASPSGNGGWFLLQMKAEPPPAVIVDLGPVTVAEDEQPVFDLETYFAAAGQPDVGPSFRVVSHTNPLLFDIPTIAGSQLTLNLLTNANGAGLVVIRTTDGSGAVVEGHLAIVVQAVDDNPVANSRDVVLDVDQSLPLLLTGDDGDPEIVQALTFALAAGPEHGTLSEFDPVTGRVVYTPHPGYQGPDHFTFTVSDGNATSLSATVSLTVQALNQAPEVIRDFRLVLDEDTVAEFDLWDLVSDAETPDPDLTFSLSGIIAPLSIQLLEDGHTVRVKPSANWYGGMGSVFTVSDSGDGAFAPITVGPVQFWVTVQPVNDPPQARSEQYLVLEDKSELVTFGTDWADNSSPVQDVTVNLLSGPEHGSLVFINAHQAYYTPNPNYAGDDAIIFTVTDNGAPTGLPLTSDVGTITITVREVDDPTQASGGHLCTAEDTMVEVDLWTLVQDIDTPLNQLQFQVTASHGQVTLAGDGHTVRYMPASNFHGLTSFFYRVSDELYPDWSAQPGATLTVTVAPHNDGPVGRDDAYSTPRGVPLVVSQTAPPTAAGQTPFTVGNLLILTTDFSWPPSSALQEFTPDGVHVRTIRLPGRSFAAIVDHTGKAQVIEGDFASSLTSFDPLTGTFARTTLPGWNVQNYAALAATANFVFATDEGGPDERAPSGILRFNLDDLSAVRFAADKVYKHLSVGYDGLLYAVMQGQTRLPQPGGGFLSVSAIEVYNPTTLQLVRTIVPQVNIRDMAVDASGHLFGLGFDSLVHLDPNGAVVATLPIPLSTSLEMDAAGRLVVVSGNGVYLSDLSLSGYRQVANLSLPVQATFVTHLATGGTPLSVLANDTDVELDPLAVTLESGPSHGTLELNADGTFTYTPNTGFVGEDLFTYRVGDGVASSVATVTIQVTGGMAPTAVVLGPSVARSGVNLEFQVAASDDNQADGFTYFIDWNGDGVTDQVVHGGGTTLVHHKFARSGRFEVRVTAEDAQGLRSALATHVISVIGIQTRGKPSQSTVRELEITGTSGAETIEIVPGWGRALVTVIVNNVRLGNFQPLNWIRVRGLGSNDLIRAGDLYQRLHLEGGGGADSLFAGNASDILLGGPGDDVLAGGTGRDLLRGGAGHDLLDGHYESDSLLGGEGADILIGGIGRDLLVGGRGSDLLISGAFTWFVGEPPAAAIHAAWSVVTDPTYLQSVIALQTGSGLPPGVKLDATTVFDDDNPKDALRGGPGLDWFFAKLGSDRLFDRQAQEVLG